jgi:hypothetical protein
LVLYSLLEDAEITVPRCPVVRTASGGFHRYLIIPKGFRIRPRVALFPGIDILTAVSNVILPGSRTSAGDYRALRSFEESPIPEAPRALMKLIRDAQRSRQSRLRASPASFMVSVDTAEVSGGSGTCCSETAYSSHSGTDEGRLATPRIPPTNSIWPKLASAAA